MDKKKAVKLATASAVAASAFVAANPHASQAATDVATVVSQAKAQMKQAYYTYSHTVTETGKLPNISDVYAAYNKAKKAYENAVAVVNKAGGAKKDAYLADLQATYETYVFKAKPKSGEARVATYIDAYNYATKLDAMRQELKAAVDAKDLKKAEELYHDISYELKTRTVILDRVYGQSTRELLRSQFKAEAQKLRDSLIYDITVAMKAREAQDAVKAGNLDKAKAALDQVNQYVSKVTDAFKAELQKAAQDANAAYEAALTPKVESVSAINAKTIEVKFNKAVDKSTAETKTNYTLTGANSDAVASLTIDKAELKDDKKTVVLTLSNALNSKTTAQYTVNIKNVNLEASTEKVPEFTAVLVLADAVAPTVTGISYPEANTAKVEFSEPINTTSSSLSSAVTVKLDGTTKIIPATAYTLAADKKSFTIDFTKTGLEYGKNYTITVNGLTDFANNALTKFEGTLNFVQDVENPQVVSLTALDLRHLKVVFSEKIKDKNAIQVYVDNALDSGATITDFDPSNPDGKTFVIRLSSAKSNGATHLIKLTSFQDKAGNPVNPVASNYIQAVTFNETAPALTNTVPTIKKFGNKVYAVLAFDRNVEVNGTPSVTLTYVDSNSVTRTTTATLIDNETEANLAANEVAIDVTSFVTGTYTFDLPAASVADIYGNGVKLVKGLTFSHTEQLAEKSVVGVWINDADNAEDTSLATVDGTTRTPDNNVVYVQFSEPVGAEALDVTKYTVDGVQVFEKAILDGSSNLVKLTLRDGAITATGKKNFAVTGIPNVKDITIYKDQTTAQAASSTAPYFDGSEFTENVKPVVESVKLVDLDKIQVKFSEDLNGATVQNADFQVKVDGSVVSTTAVEENGYVTLTLGTPVPADKVNKVTLEVLATSDIADLKGNVVVPYAAAPVTVALSDLTAQAKVKLDNVFNLFESNGTLKSGVTTGQVRSAVNDAKAALDAAGLTNSTTKLYIDSNANGTVEAADTTFAEAHNTIQYIAGVLEALDQATVLDLTVTENYDALFTTKKASIDTYRTSVTSLTATDVDTKVASVISQANTKYDSLYAATTGAKAKLDAALTLEASAKSAANTAVDTTNKTNIDAAETALKALKAALDATDNLDLLTTTHSLLEAKYNEYFNSVKNDPEFTFTVTEGASETIKIVFAGTDVTTFTVGTATAGKDVSVSYSVANIATVADNGAVSAINDNVANSTVVTITDNFWGKSDTVTVNTNAANAVDVQND
ncbi:Ig-like domain-containing protein [Geobacillus stearothermophilus]|nr:Ig-like domain-containing protein [Geobacillus stearothermophilus]